MSGLNQRKTVPTIGEVCSADRESDEAEKMMIIQTMAGIQLARNGLIGKRCEGFIPIVHVTFEGGIES